MKYLNDVFAFILVAAFLILAVIFTPIEYSGNNWFGLASSPIYTGYAVPINSIVVDNNVNFASSTDTIQKTVDATDDIVYRQAYISYDGGVWTPFNLTPTGIGTLNGNWIYGRGNTNIVFTPSNLHINNSRNFSNNTFIIIYTCSKNTTIHNWTCHEGWQIVPFKASFNSGSSSSTFTWTGELMKNGGFEDGNFNYWTTINGAYSNGFSIATTGNALYIPQNGSYCAYFSGSPSDLTGTDFYIYQDIDLNAYASSIASGTAYVNASGWGVSSEYPPNGVDKTRIQIMFLDSSGAIIQTAVDSGTVSKNDNIWWQTKISYVRIPTNTRYIRMWGTSSDQYNSKFDESGSLDSFSVKIGYGGTSVTPPPCNSVCSLNAKQCTSSTAYQTCLDNDGNGCYEWGSATSCPSGQTCSGSGACSTLATTCLPNVKECVGTSGYRTCNSAGTAWTNTNCLSGQTCSGAGICSTPATTCTANVKECVGTSGYRTCNSAGTSWTNTNCPTGQVCTGSGTCAVFTGTIYFVSTNGNDGNNGTQASPYKTLSYACSKVTTSGSIIHINAGSYSESSACNLAVGVSIEGDGSGTSGSVISSSVASGNTGEFSDLYTIVLKSSSLNTAGNQHVSNIRMDGQNTAWGAIGVLHRGNVEISGVYIQNFNVMGVSFDNTEQTSNYAKGNKIHDSTILNSAGYFGGGSQANLKIITQDSLQIYNNIITVSSDANGRLSGDPIYAVEGYLKNVKIYDNTITKTYVPNFSKWDFAIEIWNSYEGNEIYNNNIIGSIDLCIGHGGSPYSVWVHDNVIGQDGLKAAENTRGIDLEGHNHDIIIERNLIKNTATGINMNLEYGADSEHGAADQSNIKMDYNVMYNIGVASSYGNSKGWGIWYGYGEDMGVSITNIQILNNVIIGAGTGSGSTMYGIGLPYEGTPSNVVVKNNIIANFDSAAAYGYGKSISGFSMDSNILYGNGANSITNGGGTATNTYVVDPKFTSATDFHLQSTSPAINKGVNVGLSLDKDNKAVSNPPEIGAYEYPQ